MKFVAYNLILTVAAVFVRGVHSSKLVAIPFTGVRHRRGTGLAASAVNVPLENIDVAYLIDIEIGTPPQPFTLLLDTGSSTTWVPEKNCGRLCGYPSNTYDSAASSTFNESAMQNLPFGIRYGRGFAQGYYAQDTLTVHGVPVPRAKFAISDSNDGELTAAGADGILGMGPDSLSRYNNPDDVVVPTLATTMYEDGIIDENVFSIYFKPIDYDDTTIEQQRRVNGAIVFGGGKNT
ncbi:aspartic peptidase domain-containing protein [Mycotypha africana]|uniref:aspartic peptidase domain-containing protein n=1 Tax=Mycotypha africana TaxID=64632 RepID=UPI002301A410|nr:aspartic peptidase domain-containing protein [Mycotypha africana]KAI8982225.1 aspartic peptidase domain-containing protein [Mycotypha africana]